MSTKRKAPSRIAPPVVKPSARLPTRTGIDERNADVGTGEVAYSVSAKPKADMIEISSDSEGSSEEEDDAQEDEDEEMGGAGQDEAEAEAGEKARVNGDAARPDDADAATEGTESDGENGAPSFGDLLREQQTIDVGVALAGEGAEQGSLVPQGGSRALVAPSASSLGTVLNQALRTDDTELLESCFATNDIAVVHNTIERLDSGLAGNLLVHLATRLHRRPGRAGTLMHWVQWTLVVHGGALAAQPEAMTKLASLQKVLAVRARGLNSLLILKGKLDLLESQLKLRKRVQARQARRGVGSDGEDDEDEDDENVIYVDGEGDEGSGSGAARRGGLLEDDDEIDDVLLMNGIAGDSDDEEDDVSVGDDDDDEGEESLDEDEVNFDDVDESMGEDDESDVEAAPPAKKLKGTK
ncbi:related to UTP5 protein [Cephalotrichum gorgonifer]|uniref:Related to UTP5 protein n=1 Tax=Cephalotrichum gorgonifer TaxID=2041049 RepID=A0AAE8SXT0_9PEZI|nr:related to UTP5 protein [Cephalotrichum gorgonifer]